MISEDKLEKLQELDVDVPSNLYNKIIAKSQVDIKSRHPFKFVMNVTIILVLIISSSIILLSSRSNQDKVPYIHRANISYAGSAVDLLDHTLETMFIRSAIALAGKKNTVYSPITDYLNLLMTASGSSTNTSLIGDLGYSDYEAMMAVYKNYMESINFITEDGLTSIKSFSALALVDVPQYRDDGLKKLCKNGYISSIHATVSDLYKTARTLFNAEIGLDMDFESILKTVTENNIVAFTGLTLVDSFSEYKKATFANSRILFNNEKQVDGLRSTEMVNGYFKDETIEMVNFSINCTDLIFIVPSNDINTFDISSINLSWMTQKFGTLEVPYFDVDTTIDTTDMNESILSPYIIMEDIGMEDYEFANSFCQSKFEFDEGGVKGQAIAVSIAIPTSAPSEPEFHFIVDRPFYFISSYQGIPLFIGKIISL